MNTVNTGGRASEAGTFECNVNARIQWLQTSHSNIKCVLFTLCVCVWGGGLIVLVLEIRPQQSAKQKGTLYTDMKQIERKVRSVLRSVLFFPAMQPQRPVFTVYKKRDTGCTIKTQRQHAHIRRGSNRAFDSPVMLNTAAEKHNFLYIQREELERCSLLKLKWFCILQLILKSKDLPS